MRDSLKSNNNWNVDNCRTAGLLIVTQQLEISSKPLYYWHIDYSNLNFWISEWVWLIWVIHYAAIIFAIRIVTCCPIWFLTAAYFFYGWVLSSALVLCEQSICCSHTGLDLEALQVWNGPPASGLHLTINLCVLVDWLSQDKDWSEVKGYNFSHEISGFHFANWSCLQVQTVSCALCMFL